MRPLSQFGRAERAAVRFVLADIDDTITTEGRLPAASLGAMERMRTAGLVVVPVTGRPAGWCDHIARMWPVDAVVGENGAFWFSYDQQHRKMRSKFARCEKQRKTDRERLDELKTEILAAVPGAGIASDQFCRVADLAIDICEDVNRLGDEDINRIIMMFQAKGANAKVSSIHVNGWFGDYDKLSMTKDCFRHVFGIDIAGDDGRFVFVGDSPNDQPMFDFFPNSVGVANVSDFCLDKPPAWVTSGRAAAGFWELADCLVEAR